MLVWYHNPNDKESVEALQALFVSGERMPVVNSEVGRARLVLTSEDMSDEWAVIADPAHATRQAVGWLRQQDAAGAAHGKPIDFKAKDVPPGVLAGRGKGAGRGHNVRGGGGL